MKKVLITLAAVVILACSLFIVASAADYGYLADDLNSLGLFKGTDTGYDLDSGATRAQAVTMLVRLLGKDATALAGGFQDPFTDVPEWAAPYVAYAYQNGLTNGVSDTAFGPSGPCSAQMYVTFVLRALGYDDKLGDFSYANAIDFGKTLGIVDDALTSGDFLRDQMVAVSYRALFTQPNGGANDTLLQKLIAGGAIDVNAAADVLNKFALFDEFSAVGSELQDAKKIAMTMNMDMQASAFGQSVAMTMNMDMNMIMGENDDILASIKMDINTAGEAQTMQMYIANGYAYVDDGTKKEKMDLALSGSEDMLNMANVSQFAAFPSYAISDISKSNDGDFTVYTIKIADAFMTGVMSQALGMVGDMGFGDVGISDMSLSIPEMQFYVDSSGALTKIIMPMEVKLTVDTGGVAVTVPVSANMEMNITAVGDAVTVTLPNDLGDYVLVDTENAVADGMAA